MGCPLPHARATFAERKESSPCQGGARLPQQSEDKRGGGLPQYDPHTGRWTAKDPILFAGLQANLYVYVGNDPVNRVDPDGLIGVAIGGSGSAGFCLGLCTPNAGGGGGTYIGTEGIGHYTTVDASVGAGIFAGVGPDVGLFTSLDAFAGAGYGLKLEGGFIGEFGASVVGNPSGLVFNGSLGHGGGIWAGGVASYTFLHGHTTWGEIAEALWQDVADWAQGPKDCR